MDNTGSALCLACHTDANWPGSAHGNSSAPLAGAAMKLAAGKRGAKTVAGNACTTCHDSHGVAANDRLINFNRDYVTPSAAAGGRLEFKTTGSGGVTCTLTCHGVDHAGTTYPGAQRILLPHR